LPRKLHVRNGLLEDRHDLGVRSAAILLRPAADSPQVTGFYECGFPGEEAYLTFRYQVLRIWQLAPEPLLTGGLALLPLAPISAVTEGDLPGIIRRMERRLSGRAGQKQSEQVWAAAYILLGLRFTPELPAQLFRGVVSMKESSTYQAILEEGRAEGAAAEARKLLRIAGDGKFGPPDAATTAAVERINALERLEALFERLQSAASWQELLGSAPTGRQRRRQRPTP
jgi:predicted transposase YdaD